MSTTMTTTITRRDSVTDIAPVEPVKITKNSIKSMLALVSVMNKFKNHYSTGRKELTIELDRCDFNTNLEEFGASVNAITNMLARHTPSRAMVATAKARVERHWVPMPNIAPRNDLNSASMQCDDIMISVNDHLYAFTIAAAYQRGSQLTRLAVTGPLQVLDWSHVKQDGDAFLATLETEKSEAEYKTRTMKRQWREQELEEVWESALEDCSQRLEELAKWEEEIANREEEIANREEEIANREEDEEDEEEIDELLNDINDMLEEVAESKEELVQEGLRASRWSEEDDE